MKTIEFMMEELKENELKEGFEEIVEWRKSGVLTEGIVRKIHKDYTSQMDTNYPIYNMENPFLFEIARRYYGK